MSITGITRRARRRAQAVRMRDSCIIRPVVGHTTNPDGTVVPEYGPAVYSGECELQVQTFYPVTPEAGEHQWTVLQAILKLPVEGSEQVGTDQLAEMIGSFDPANVGRTFRVRSSDRQAFQASVQFLVEEVS